MKTFRILAVSVGLAVAVALSGTVYASAAAKNKTVSFKGSYTGTSALLIDGSSVKVLSVTGNGTSSLIGSSTLSGTANATAEGGSACVPFQGSGTIKGATGTINVSVSTSKGQGCSSGQSGPVTVQVTGTATAIGGTGSAKGAKGSLKFKGTLKLNDTTGNQTGTFTGTVSGKLTVSK